MSATVVVGPSGEQNGVSFPYAFLANALFNPTITTNSSFTEATITPDQNVSSPGYYDVIIGTNLNNHDDGVVTGFTANDPDGVEFTASGLSLNVGQLEDAIQTYQTNPQAGVSAMHDIFSAVDWQIDFSDQTVGSQMFGTGGDDVITLGSGQDELMIDGGSDVLDAGAGNDFIYAGTLVFSPTAGFSTVIGGDGSDTFCLDFREFGEDVQAPIAFFSAGQKVDLNKLLTFGDTVVKLQGVENVRGSEFNDQLTGDANGNRLNGEEGNDKLLGKAGGDTIIGGDGDDKITGGANADKLTGNKGDDDFIFTAVADSAKQHDIITDFHHKQDDIDLTKLHPDTKHDKFVFIGDGKFSHHAGELQVIEHDNSGTKNDFTMVMADLDGNGKAELQIELTGLIHMDANDFLL